MYPLLCGYISCLIVPPTISRSTLNRALCSLGTKDRPIKALIRLAFVRLTVRLKVRLM